MCSRSMWTSTPSRSTARRACLLQLSCVFATRVASAPEEGSESSGFLDQEATSAIWAEGRHCTRTIDVAELDFLFPNEFCDERGFLSCNGDERHRCACPGEGDIEQSALFGMRIVIAARHGEQQHRVVDDARRESQPIRRQPRTITWSASSPLLACRVMDLRSTHCRS